MLKVTVLVENTKGVEERNIKAEHGISLYIETGESNILFDTGNTACFYHNSKILGKDISHVDKLIISHEHCDHGGGLKSFIDNNNAAQIYLKGQERQKCYVNFMKLFYKYVGLNEKLINKYNYRFSFVDKFTMIGDNLYIISDIDNKKYKSPKGNESLFIKKDGVYYKDDFQHEIIFVVKEADGLVVFTGCSHNGILNMIDTVKNHFKDETIKAVFGGFHLFNPINKTYEEEDEILNIGKILKKDTLIKKIYTGHCTGEKAYYLLKSILEDKLDWFRTGKIYDI